MNFKNNLKNILIAHCTEDDQNSKDEEDTINQAIAIKNCLQPHDIEVEIFNLRTPLKINFDKISYANPDIIFNLVEAIRNKGKYSYLAPLFFDKLQIPYTGNSKEAIKITTNKIITKEILKKNNIPTPKWLIDPSLLNTDDESYIVKSVTEDASIGINMDSIIFNKKQMKQVITEKIKTFGGLWFAEKYIDGREFNISILEKDNEPLVLPCAEIIFDDAYDNYYKIVDYAAKWDEQSVFYDASYRVFPKENHNYELFNSLKEISLKCWKLFNLSGYARIDFRVDSNNNPMVLEINANPCIAPEAGFVAAAKRAGINYQELIETIAINAKHKGHKYD